MSGGGFSFGGNTSFGLGNFSGSTSGTAGGSNLTLGTPATTTSSLAGSTPHAPSAGGFNFGSTSTGIGGSALGGITTTHATSGFTLGGTTTSTSGFSLGGVTTSATGFPLGGTTTASSGGFNLGGTTTTTSQQPSLLGGLLGSGNKTATLTLGTATTTTPSFGGLGKIGTSTQSSTGLSLSGATTSTTPASTGLALGAKPGTTAPSLGLQLGSTSTASTTGLSGGALGLIASTTTTSRGLGGVDTKSTVSSSGNVGADGKTSDSKTVKETGLPGELLATVENFKKYVKSQKSVREDIARMTSKQMFRVQEDVASLKQLLSVVSNGLQRNTMSITKLKLESAQELKNAEIAQRTKDTPPGLQYENTAPTEYFQCLVQEFEIRMIMYRQQIEEMESHLMSLQQPSVLTPQELTVVLRKMHESFIALAAQLQVVHEHVKVQKEHYLNYRKVFHGERNNIFETRKRTVEKINTSKTYGPSPFTGISNATAVAMATALNRTQQPAGAPPTLGLGIRPLLGTSNTLGGQTSSFGTGIGNFFGSGSTGGLFGSSTAVTTSSTGLFSSPAQPSTALGGSSLGTSTPLVGFNISGTSAVTPTQQPFQLQKPPAGSNKRGKKS